MYQSTQALPSLLLKFRYKLRQKKVPTIIQSERAECSLACIGMILGYYGYNVDLVQLRELNAVSSKGVNLKGVIDISSKFGLSAQALKVECNALNAIKVPCILHWEDNHFVVLTKVSRSFVTIHDPAFGVKKIPLEELPNFFKRVVLELAPNDNFIEKNLANNLKLSDLITFNKSLKKSISYLVGLSILAQLLMLTMPMLTQTLLDKVVIEKNQNIVTPLIIGFFLLLLVRTTTNYFRQWLSLYFSHNLSFDMASKTLNHLIKLPIDYFDKKNLGDISSRFESIHHIRNIITSVFASSVVNLLMLIITAIAMLFYSIEISLIVFSFVSFFIFVRLYLYHRERTLTEETFVGHSQHESHFLETMRSMQTIKVFQKENERHEKWQEKLSEAYDKDINLGRLQLGLNTFTDLLFGLEYIVTILLAAKAVYSDTFSIGMLFAYLTFKTFFIDSSRSFLSEALHIRLIELHLRRLSDIMLTRRDPSNLSQIKDVALPIDSQLSSIEVRNLSFSYAKEEEPVFENLNFTIRAGESIAIVGQSGCGKTTLLKCLMGLLQPSFGDILINGHPIKDIDDYRDNISGVMQSDKLFSGSIAENISCFSKNIDMNRVKEVAKLAALCSDIKSMPMKYQSIVGELGSTLSGGQKQRVEIARALYKKPKYLFMDEATSHLDTANENIININIASLGITRIIVAHRKETILSVDRVIDLSKRKA